MLEMPWLESHVGTIDDCIEAANKMLWNLSVFESEDGKWHVKGGESRLFSSKDRGGVDAFLYGMGLAYSAIPEDPWQQLQSEMKQRYT